MKKHAFLIMAHNKYDQLRKLIELLDDERADIYLHIDKKSELPVGLKTKHSQLYLFQSIDIQWGGYSQIACELLLLREAVAKGYEYYHSLSGIDLPLVSNDEFYAFFQVNRGKNYISAMRLEEGKHETFWNRMMYYRVFHDNRLPKIVKRIFNKLSVMIQMPFIDRTRKIPFELYLGDSWFSITDEMARFVVNNNYPNVFKQTICGDELFIPSIAMASPYKDTVTGTTMRYIDWQYGGDHPKVFTIKDYDELMNSGCLFARKFSDDVDAEIIDTIYRTLSNQNGKAEVEIDK